MGASMADPTLCSPPRQPVSVLVIHGTDDPLVPYGGGQVAPPRPGGGRTVAIDRAVEFWCRADSIRGARVIEELPHIRTGGDPRRTTRFRYPPGAGGARVELLRVEHGGHAEPSRKHVAAAPLIFRYGPQSHDFECAEEAWSFFREATGGR
jgi:polyhydroxybutyrate depolymerase